MANDPLTYEDLLRIVEILKASEKFSEFRLKVGDIEVELRRRVPAPQPTSDPPTAERAPASPSSPPSTGARAETGPASAAAPATMPSSPSPAQPVAGAPHPEQASADWPKDAIVIRAPMVGTFYRAPEPGARPFVEVGDPVGPDSIVCIIEVMKLMNSISAGAEGEVTHILVEDAAPVEAQAPLIVLSPHPR